MWEYNQHGYRRVSIFLIVVGAILAFVVDATVSGLDLNVVGCVLMLPAWPG